MKNLKMFAIAIMAFAVMAMGVHATGGEYPSKNTTCNGSNSCTAKLTGSNGTYYYTGIYSALTDAEDGDTIKLLKDAGVSFAQAIENKKITINVDKYTLKVGGAGLTVGEKGSLTISGTTNGKVIVQSAATGLLAVEKGGSLTISGALTVDSTGASTAIASLIDVNDGSVTVSNGATLKAATGKDIVAIGADGATVSLNATVGTKSAPFGGNLITTAALTGDATTKVTFEGGEYYVSSIATVDKENVSVVVNNGTFKTTTDALTVSNGSVEIKDGSITSDTEAITLTGGKVLISGGTLKTTTNAVIWTDSDGEGSLTITGGKITNGKDANYNPLHFNNGALTYAISGVEVASDKKDMPAIWINDDLLVGLADSEESDHFKGMLTSGKYLYSIIGKATIDGENYPAANVAKYIVAEGKDITTEGDYKVVGTGTSTPSDEPGTTEPGDTTIPPVPQTNDNILVYAGLGLVSLASVAFTAKKRED